MIGPSIEPSEVGLSGLIWLLLSYGYVLYYSSNMISEGSEYLLLVPELAGLVGGVVLPMLGAIPDGAIILFSGLGDKETAQETLSVGVGTLAGSTIMLLTVPFALSIFAGRVDLDQNTGHPNYMKQPKLDQDVKMLKQLTTTGVSITEAVQHSGLVMMVTTIPYFLIQVPASFMHGSQAEVSLGERWWAFSALLVCLSGLFVYMRLQLKASRAGEDQNKRIGAVKKMLTKGQISLSGAMASTLRESERAEQGEDSSHYQALSPTSNHDDVARYPPPAIANFLKEILSDAFYSYDSDGNGQLERRECYVFFRDFNETISEDEMNRVFARYDTDKSGHICLDEFVGLAYTLIKMRESGGVDRSLRGGASRRTIRATAQISEQAFAKDEEEEIPEEFTDLPPDKQQAAIKKRAFIMLAIGTSLVFAFSDPMVDVMQEIATRAGLNSFYVSFILAPLASNASEVVSSMYYAAKKTRKTITVSLSTLCGAAALNNTFCLSIFFFLIYARGLAWRYSAETIAIVTVELILGFLVQKSTMSFGTGVFVLCIFPLSLVLVATLEAFGMD